MTKATRACYTLEFKEEAVCLVTGGESVATIAKNLGLSDRTQRLPRLSGRVVRGGAVFAGGLAGEARSVITALPGGPLLDDTLLPGKVPVTDLPPQPGGSRREIRVDLAPMSSGYGPESPFHAEPATVMLVGHLSRDRPFCLQNSMINQHDG